MLCTLCRRALFEASILSSLESIFISLCDCIRGLMRLEWISPRLWLSRNALKMRSCRLLRLVPGLRIMQPRRPKGAFSFTGWDAIPTP